MGEERSRAKASRAAIERLYVAMRHLFIRGSYKPQGVSGESMVESLKILQPEIYGSIADPEKVELDGLLYVMQRLPKGIEECRFIKLISREGLEKADFTPIIPPKRKRHCYRIDHEQMYIEMTRGRSDIYDILTHLTFLYIEAEKIRKNSEDHKGRKSKEWLLLEKKVKGEFNEEELNKDIAFTYLSTLLGRTFEETHTAAFKFEEDSNVNDLFHIVYWLGLISTEEARESKDREIWFSAALRERIRYHYYGELWAKNIHDFIIGHEWQNKDVHIISANLHSVMNCLYGHEATGEKIHLPIEILAEKLRKSEKNKVRDYARNHGMYEIDDTSGTNISVQIFNIEEIPANALRKSLNINIDPEVAKNTLIIVMDYAFGEQAYETMDELIKPFAGPDGEISLQVKSISIMGKAGILDGKKGDIMVPTAHIFEGTADNYPLNNLLSAKDFEGKFEDVYEGPMITVLGTSLQNREILKHFLKSSWKAIGLEMEGAHYQKAIQSASQIRNSIPQSVKLLYAYYASDNPLQTGHTLASGSLGPEGVKPTYLITQLILEKILNLSI
jgi:hypothetical protein